MSIERSPLYQEIYQEIENNILNGNLVEGDKIYTESEIMDKYGVSRITATRALNELANNGYIMRKRRVGSVVACVNSGISNKSINIKKTNETMLIALVTPYSAKSGFNIFSYILHNDEKYNLLTSLFISENSIVTERKILKKILQLDIDGLISVPVESYNNISFYMQLREKGIPMVFMDRHIPWLDIPYVSTDNYLAMYKLTEWLITHDYHKIAICFNSISISTESERLRGYISALNDYKIPLDQRYILDLSAENIRVEAKRNNLRNIKINEFLRFMMRIGELPEVIMCINDLTASQVAQQAKLLGLTIPDDIAITGFDNDSISGFLDTPLTTVSQDYNILGQKAIQLLFDIKNKVPSPSNILVEAPLLIRNSTRN